MKTIFKNLKQPFLKITMVPRRTILTEGGATVQNKDYKMLEFDKGIYATEDKDEIAYIKERMKLNANIIEITPQDQEAIKEREEDEREAKKIVAEKQEERRKKRSAKKK